MVVQFALVIERFGIKQKSQKFEARRQLVWNDECTMNSIDCTIAPIHPSFFCMPPRESQGLESRREVFCTAFDLVSYQYHGASLRCTDLQAHGFEAPLAVTRFDKVSTAIAVDTSAALV